MARQKKVVRHVVTHEPPSPTWQEPSDEVMDHAVKAITAATKYDRYAHISFKELIDAYENLRTKLERATKALKMAEAIVSSEHLSIQDVLEDNKVP